MEKNTKIILLQKLSSELSFLDYNYLDLEGLRPFHREVNNKLETLIREKQA